MNKRNKKRQLKNAFKKKVCEEKSPQMLARITRHFHLPALIFNSCFHFFLIFFFVFFFSLSHGAVGLDGDGKGARHGRRAGGDSVCQRAAVVVQLQDPVRRRAAVPAPHHPVPLRRGKMKEKKKKRERERKGMKPQAN